MNTGPHKYWRFIEKAILNSHAPRCCEYRWVDENGAHTPDSYSLFGTMLDDNDSAATTSFDGNVNTIDKGLITNVDGGIVATFNDAYVFTSFGANCSYGGGARGANFDLDFSDDGTNWTNFKNWDFNASGTGWYDVNTDLILYIENYLKERKDRLDMGGVSLG